MGLRLSIEMARALGIDVNSYIVVAEVPAPQAEARPKPKPAAPADGMNKTERAYSRYLENLRIDGRILRWDFEPVKLRLAGRTFYSPDFRVILIDGSTEMHETKGFMRDDAAAKIKIAAFTHPYMFRLAYKVRGGWEWRTVDRSGIGLVEPWEV